MVAAADAAAKGAVCDGAKGVVADDAADMVAAADTDAARDAEVLHFAAAADIAKEALIIGIAAGVFYVEAADGVPVAVEGASVLPAAVADWGPLGKFVAIGDRAIFVNLHVWVEVDIGGEDGVGGRFAAVNELGKIPQLLGGRNLVRIIRCAGAAGERPLTTL